MSYVLLVVACLTGQPGECREHHLPLPQITNATVCHLGGAVRLREWVADHEGWRLTDVKCLQNSKVASVRN
jgi:hypothetical protein